MFLSPPGTEDNEERVTKTGGHEFNDPHHRSGGSNPPWCAYPSHPPLDFVHLADGGREMSVRCSQ
jgi:hypothetical protein